MMTLVPEIVGLRRLDVYRDGGSVSATFTGADGIDYRLFFKVRRVPAEGASRQYREPLLEWFGTAEYRSPITGDISPVSIPDSAPVTWAEARRIVDELRPFYESRAWEDRGVFAEMIDAAARNGREPQESSDLRPRPA